MVEVEAPPTGGSLIVASPVAPTLPVPNHLHGLLLSFARRLQKQQVELHPPLQWEGGFEPGSLTGAGYFVGQKKRIPWCHEYFEGGQR